VKKRILLYSIIFQVVIILTLVVGIFQNIRQNPTHLYKDPLNKIALTPNKNSKLQFFYEINPSQIQNINPWIPYRAKYSINNDDLNETKNYPIKKSVNSVRIVTLGDSFTFGLYVDTKYNWPEQLEVLLNSDNKCAKSHSYEVINLGVPGYDIQYALERFKLRGIKYNPDLVLWFIKDGNMLQLNDKMLGYEKEIKSQLEKSGEFDKLVKAGDSYPSWDRAMRTIQNKYTPETILSYQKSYLKSLNDIYKNRLLIFTYPETNTTYKNLLKNFINDRPNSAYFDEITDTNRDSSLYFTSDMHPNSKGYKMIAMDLLQFLKKKYFICN